MFAKRLPSQPKICKLNSFTSSVNCALRSTKTPFYRSFYTQNDNYNEPEEFFSPQNKPQTRSFNTPFKSNANNSIVQHKPTSQEPQSFSRQSTNNTVELLHIDTAPHILISEISSEPFSDQVLHQLNEGFNETDVEIKPDGIIYLPEIKYRRILNSAFGPGGWVMIPRGAPVIRDNILYREYALYCYGKFVSQAVGEQVIQSSMSEGTAIESSKSNALMRCCKDLGVASELWDVNFIEEWKDNFAIQAWCKNERTGEMRQLWRRKDRPPFTYPWKENAPTTPPVASQPSPPVRKAQPTQPPVRAAPPPQPVKSAQPPPSRRTPVKPPVEVAPPPPPSRGRSFTNQKIQKEEEQEEEEVEEEEEVDGEDKPQAPAPILDHFEPDSIVPPQMRRYTGKTWRQVSSSKDGLNYLNWASTNAQLPQKIKDLATAALEWHDSVDHSSDNDY